MSLRRGFKTEADAHARELRAELHLLKHAPLCPWKLARHLAIPIIPLSALRPFAPEAVRTLLGPGRGFFSAVTVFGGRHGCVRLVCHNDGHAKTRQAADISHELSHAILGHPPTRPFEGDDVAEEEAKWLGPALLVSQEAAMHVAFHNLSVESAAGVYGVSEDLMRMRLNVTGALKRAGRSRTRTSA